MKTEKLRGSVWLGAVVYATVLLLTGCETAGSISVPPDASVGETTLTPSSAPSPSTVASTDGCGSANISVDYAPFTTSTLAGYGWGFAVGTVTSIEPAIFNTPDGSMPTGFMVKPGLGKPRANGKIYTPIDVQVDQAISGPMKPGVDRVLIEGGTVGCYTTRVDVSPVVEKGARYVFVVTDAQDSGGTSLLGLQEAKFAWPVDAVGTVETVDGPMTLDQLGQVVAKAPVAPKP